MKIRTQLILAFLFLAVLPLTGIVLYSYSSSLSAVRRAVEEEAGVMTVEMEQRMAAIRTDLSYRFESIGPVSFATLIPHELTPGSVSLSSFEQGFVTTMGDSAALFDSLEFVPAAPPSGVPEGEAHAAAPAASTMSAPTPPTAVRPARPAQPAELAASYIDREAIVVDVSDLLRELEESGELEAAEAESVGEAINAAADIAALVTQGVLQGMSEFDMSWTEDLADAAEEAEIEKQRRKLAVLSERVADAQDAQEAALEGVIEQLEEAVASGDEERQEELEEILENLQDQVDDRLDDQEERLEEMIEMREDTLEAAEERQEGLEEWEVEYTERWEAVAERMAARFEAWADEIDETDIADGEDVVVQHMMHEGQVESHRMEAQKIIGKELHLPVRREGEVIGKVRALVSQQEIISRVLASSERESGEVPFAVDAEGSVYFASPEDQELIESLELNLGNDPEQGERGVELWVVATTEDAEIGLTYGIARPIRESLAEIRSTAVRNFGYGMGLIGLALLGILPLSARMSRNVSTISEGAEKLAAGDLSARVPVQSRNELGSLAQTFNRMASELEDNRSQLLEEERLRRENEVQQSLLEADIARKTAELEEARSFQLSLLPDRLPDHPAFDLAVSMQTATEVGGDFYDFMVDGDGPLTVAIGDATGHGAKAGTMVTVIKSIFSAYTGEGSLEDFLEESARVIRRMRLGRMSMALALVRLEPRRLTTSSAGMPPALVYRAATNSVEEIATAGVPLGTLADVSYSRHQVDLESGDCVLLMTDGLPELLGADGEVFGYQRVEQTFAGCARRPAAEIIDELTRVASEWTAGGPPNDDITFVVARIT